jgi:hypothetical protein
VPPLNRIVAFVGPIAALGAGAAATWLGRHFPGLHLNTSTTAGEITQAIEFAVGAFVTLALQRKWLDGWQKWEAAIRQSAAAPDTTQLTSATPRYFPQGDYDPVRDMPPAISPEALDASAAAGEALVLTLALDDRPVEGAPEPIRALPRSTGGGGGRPGGPPEGQGRPGDG